ncbi:MAG: hypothetical protein BRC29_01105 [Nanohaloarchaea archaeon SW_7_43_1]|nr:MAG: hypothetical protein BRC29_01105 [Nanohaloarchaea archaeon SW_7_43_1]
MGIITISMNDEVEENLRERISDNKGALGDAITEAVGNWLDKQNEQKYQERALKRLEEGYEMGEIQYEKRSELHDRHTKNTD